MFNITVLLFLGLKDIKNKGIVGQRLKKNSGNIALCTSLVYHTKGYIKGINYFT